MRHVMALVGSRGDVQPALAVALELRRRGHEVVTGVAPNLVPLAGRLGLDPVPLGIDSAALLGSDLVRRDMRSAHPVRRVRALRAVASAGWDELRTGLLALLDDVGGADTVVTGLLGQEVAAAVAERRGLAMAALHYCPVRANGVVSPVSGVRGPRATRTVWALGERVRWGLTRRAENDQRAALGLGGTRVHLPTRLRDAGAVEVQAYDPALAPGLVGEWGPRRPLTGFLALDDDARARLGETGSGSGVDGGGDGGAASLDAWLDDGEPPVYVGFGSMPVADPAALLAAVDAACADLGVRALVSAGWNDFSGADGARRADGATGAPGPDGKRVRVVGAVDHAAVLPRCRAAVHHGGAGTTAAALRAGLPAVVGWYSADQPMWGDLLRGAGVGVARRASTLTEPGVLAGALAEVLDDATAARAAALGGRLVPPDHAVAAAADAVVSASAGA
ncbi:glycosyltransferase [Promicromonospora sukumoe]|uniref:UDP:flavonoid glycosyltransferase YjiC (YdhE family) n=1 Tax=Promicromonospora sukumoe TaxID=88382 RepID=A0A7W3JB20_9MICO|nr:nucleotide disphospho-sugar-binding domain-containing protein [Promicromonospora sukumoe]MBA8809588.1 UDP:flavonoid glycosyltransferase YjiC (YdhE family) [Promicromonospora sukumoe]